LILPAYIDKKYINIVSTQLELFSWKKDNLANCRCALCGDSKKKKTKTRFYFYEKDNKYLVKCHNCGYASDLYNFIEQVNPSLLKEYSLEVWKENNVPKKKPLGENEMISLMKKPEFNKKQDLLKPLTCIKDLSANHVAVKFAEIRKIPKKRWDLLYYTDNYGKYAKLLDPDYNDITYDPRLVIPIFNKAGNVVGAQGRVLTMKGEVNARSTLRYITVKADKSIDRLWYGLWRANPKKRIYVVEGPIDSLFISNAVAIVGAGAIDNIPVRFKDSELVYVLDNEPRNVQIIKYNEKLIKAGNKVCIWPSDIKDKDINDMIYRKTSAEIKRIIDDNTFSGLEATLKLNSWRKA
tara:strand:+ start:107 stop:1159 length:1053 start_codon:yes stop_codon:yes gene_type:complete